MPIFPDSGVDGGVDPGMWGLRVLACEVQPPLWQRECLLILTSLKKGEEKLYFKNFFHFNFILAK